MRYLFLALFLASCTAASTDVAVDRENLKLNISAFEGGVSPERLAALYGDVAGALIVLSEDTSEKAFYRARAFRALSFYPEERVFLHLKKSLSRAESLGFTVLPPAIESLASFNEQYPTEVAAILAPLTRHESIVIKEATIRVLTVNPSIEAKDLLSGMALRETEPALQDALR